MIASLEHVLELNVIILILSAGFIDHGLGKGDLLRIMSAERAKAFGVIPEVVMLRVPEERLKALMSLAGEKGRTFLFVRDGTEPNSSWRATRSRGGQRVCPPPHDPDGNPPGQHAALPGS